MAAFDGCLQSLQKVQIWAQYRYKKTRISTQLGKLQKMKTKKVTDRKLVHMEINVKHFSTNSKPALIMYFYYLDFKNSLLKICFYSFWLVSKFWRQTHTEKNNKIFIKNVSAIKIYKHKRVRMQDCCVPDWCVLTENSWMLRPLNKASLGYCGPDQCVLTLDCVKHETNSVGRYRGLGRPPAPNESVGQLAGFAYAPDQVYWIGAPPSDARSAHT